MMNRRSAIGVMVGWLFGVGGCSGKVTFEHRIESEENEKTEKDTVLLLQEDRVAEMQCVGRNRTGRSVWVEVKRSAVLTLAIILAAATVADAQWFSRRGTGTPADGKCGGTTWCTMCYPELLTQRRHVPFTAPAVIRPRATVVASTPHAIVDVMLAQLRLTPDDLLYDLGCGDGRILIAAVQQYGCKALGIEIDPKVADIARANVRLAGCGRIFVQTGDARTFNLDKATAVTMHLFTPLMAELLPKLRTTRVVSYSHRFPGRECRQVIVDGWHSVFVLEGGQ